MEREREKERWNEHERTDCIALLQATCCLSVSSFIFLTHSAKLRVAKLLPQISSNAARASHRQQQSLPCLQLTTLRGSLGTRRALPLSPIAVATCFSIWDPCKDRLTQLLLHTPSSKIWRCNDLLLKRMMLRSPGRSCTVSTDGDHFIATCIGEASGRLWCRSHLTRLTFGTGGSAWCTLPV